MPKNGAIVVELASGAATRLDSVKSLQVTEKGESWIAWLKEPAELALLKPGGASRTFADVTEFALAKDGRVLVYAVASKQEETNGVYSMAPSGSATALLSGKGKYTKLTWDRDHKQLAFLSDRDKWQLYLTDGATPATAAPNSDSWSITDRGTLNFSRDGARVFLGTGPSRPERAGSSTGERVIADLWHWKDLLIQPMQKVRAGQDRARSFRAVYHLAEKKFVQLGGETMPTVNPSDDGLRAIGAEDLRYRPMVDYDGRYADYYLIDTLTGSRRLLAERLRGGRTQSSAVTFSPDGRVTEVGAELVREDGS